MTTAAPVLATPLVSRSKAWALVGVVGFAAHTALAAQFSFLIPPIEVPFTLQTAAVLLSGGVLGARLGMASQLLYVAAGAFGLPIFAETRGGVDVLRGPTGGYLIGFVIAAYFPGRLAEGRHDRQVLSGFAAFLIGSLLIYVFGVIGLMVNLDMSIGNAIAQGVVPFVFWDVLKALAAGLVLPAAWRLGGDSG